MLLRSSIFVSALLFFWLETTEASWKIEQIRDGENIKVLSVLKSSLEAPPRGRLLRSIPWIMREDQAPSSQRYEEILLSEEEPLPEIYEPYEGGDFRVLLEKPEGAELRKIIVQGPSENRIDLTILGDGYTEDEKEKFFEDARFTADQLFKAKAFSSYLPLFNIYAVFVPSNESGLSDRERKDTAFGLRRDPPGSKRAIMPGNTRAIEAALALSPATDYPIILANDDFYGGLGGRYAITTRSRESGSVVLRHELGHNFGEVGEEYDGGQVYSGANFSSSERVSWAYWSDDPITVYRSQFLSGRYVWQNLKGKPFSASFKVPAAAAGDPFSVVFFLSAVGWEHPEDISIQLNGQPLDLKGRYTADRSFFDSPPLLMAPGNYRLDITSKIGDDSHVLAFAQVVANPPGFDYTPEKIGAFATFDDRGSFRGYRPTNNSCIMRNMILDHFCVVDRENFWKKFLARISLIDSVGVTATDLNDVPDLFARKVSVKTPPLNGLRIQWFHLDEGGGRTEIEEARDKKEWTLPESLKGRMEVQVYFQTPEIRKPFDRMLSKKEFAL